MENTGTEISLNEWLEEVRQRALKAKAETPGSRKQTSPNVHVPVPRAFQMKMRESIFMKLGQQACMKAQSLKGNEPLTRSEVYEIAEKMRAELEKKGFFDL